MFGFFRGESKKMKADNEKIRNFINKAKEKDNPNKEKYKERLNYKQKIKKLELNKKTKSVSMAIEYINSVNMLVLFGIFNSLGETFNCDFITTEKNISFISDTLEEGKKKLAEERKHLGKYDVIEMKGPEERLGFFVSQIVVKGDNVKAYISKENDKYYLNIDDMGIDNIGVYEIINNCSYCVAVKELCEKLKVKVDYIEKAKNKFKNNMELLYKIDKSSHPSLSKILGNGKINHRNRLKSIYEIAETELYNGLLDVNKREVISIPLRNLAENLSKENKISLAQLTPMINAFCLLGFLEKVKAGDMQDSFSPLKYGKHTSIFYIPEITENTLKQAEERADKLLNDGIRTTVSSFTKYACLRKFGKEITEKIYLEQ